MRITIGGVPGAGKSTVAKILAKKLGYKYYYMGSLIRKMAEDKGMDVEEFYKSNSDGTMDKMIDDYQAKIGMEEDNFIMEGRTSFHFIPNSLKVYFAVGLDTAAQRIFSDNIRSSERKYNDVGEALDAIKRRIETEKERFPKLYGFDCHHHGHYNLVIDTTNMAVEDVVSFLLKEIKKAKGSKKF